MRILLTCALLAAPPAFGQPSTAGTAEHTVTDPARQQALIRIVRQDCGSCHGMQLTGGLGPALTAAALADMPYESVLASIVHGRPGTPMPPWKSLLSAADASWIARQLQAGFPLEAKARP